MILNPVDYSAFANNLSPPSPMAPVSLSVNGEGVGVRFQMMSSNPVDYSAFALAFPQKLFPRSPAAPVPLSVNGEGIGVRFQTMTI
ncbi:MULTISPECIES: hypothetical protein [unclassified Coleofasciculus]|uniref:hypothetical protein n=1 Tax=Cyanophyceae TaxID=3028117 RepID=UPI00168A2630|nr:MULTISPECIES: hypothetical protein [unclassified Coleofasciculus]MBD1877422.1 hypothetical protein [Coleofasciculus sp. FACHB-T130]MBD1892761.1 hypothetical protein [Coleofasciculus sp. FACHB-SPT9]MBD1899967.1 hypothetical protein [Coleofasciculus sp. FACHB-125]